MSETRTLVRICSCGVAIGIKPHFHTASDCATTYGTTHSTTASTGIVTITPSPVIIDGMWYLAEQIPHKVKRRCQWGPIYKKR
jgi:hypothetical protein